MNIVVLNKKYVGIFFVSKLKPVQKTTVFTPKLPNTVPNGGEGSAPCARIEIFLMYWGLNHQTPLT